MLLRNRSGYLNQGSYRIGSILILAISECGICEPNALLTPDTSAVPAGAGGGAGEFNLI